MWLPQTCYIQKMGVFLLFAMMFQVGTFYPPKDTVYLLQDQPVSEQGWGDNSPDSRVHKITNPSLLLFPAENSKLAAPLIMIIPGGAYAYISLENEGYPVARWLNELGISAAILKYRLPDGTFDADKRFRSLKDAEMAMHWLRNHATQLNSDSQNVGVLGFSAGGHLASSLLTHSNSVSKPDFGVLVYPVISLSDDITHKYSRKNLVGKFDEYQSYYSNELWVNQQTPACFLVHSGGDGAVPSENSKRFYQALQDHNVASELLILDDGGHGYGLGKGNKNTAFWSDSLRNWMKKRAILH